MLRISKDFSRLKFSLSPSQIFNPPRHVQQIQWRANRANCFDMFQRRLGYASSFVSMQRRLRCTDVMVRPGPCVDPTCCSCTAEQVPKLQLNSLPLPAQWLGRLSGKKIWAELMVYWWFIDHELMYKKWWFIDHEVMYKKSSQIWVCKDSVIEEGLISVPNCWFLTSLSQVQPLHGEQRRTFLLSCLRLGCWANDNNVHIVLESKGKFFMMPLFTRLDETTSAKCLS